MTPAQWRTMGTLAALILLAAGFILVRLGHVLDAVEGAESRYFGMVMETAIGGDEANTLTTERLLSESLDAFLYRHHQAVLAAEEL